MSKVDDHGLYDARPSILRATLYPLRIDRVREADCTRWLAMCEMAGLIALYSAGGKPYLQMLDTKWEKRGKAKYPSPNESHPETVVNNSTQPETKDSNSSVFGCVVGVELKALSGKPDILPLNGYKAEAVKILGFLNSKTGRSYKPVESNIRMICARMKEGFSADDIRSVIAKKCAQWGGDEKMDEYLRPKTLFAASNFANYEGQLGRVE